MQIYGREYGFKLTVGASARIADLCPGGDLSKVGELMQGRYSKITRAGADFIVALSEGFETARKFEAPGYEPRPLSRELLMSLDPKTFTAVQQAAMDAFARDQRTTVEVEASKKNEGHALS